MAGIAVSLALAILWVIQKGETRHWRKASGQYEQLYTREQAALAGTVVNYRAAAEQARALDQAASERVAAEQHSISERTSHDYETRLVDARARAERLRQLTETTAHSRGGAAAPVSGLPTASGGAAQAAGQDGFPVDERLTATEQAIQLDELIKWVRRQSAIDPNSGSPARP